MTNQPKINWRPMSEPRERDAVVAYRSGSGTRVCFKGVDMRRFEGDLAWCSREDLDGPSEPFKPKPREPKLGEVWQDARGHRLMCGTDGPRGLIVMHCTNGGLVPIKTWMDRYAADATLVLAATEGSR